ncbi:hypothetical protein ACIBFB_12080 [Nocardiopsis sp. NPDC050513]|uniref:hypothetical protein n=1 Tax=unclassified Nocardiopsis TaxID=2649073 RepID=UPI000E222489|nr:hypothetical protein [Nocardiopsis sp. FIRDI 009]
MTAHIDIEISVATDEDGAWCARAEVTGGGTAYGEGDTKAEALADLRAGLAALFEVIELPDVEVAA